MASKVVGGLRVWSVFNISRSSSSWELNDVAIALPPFRGLGLSAPGSSYFVSGSLSAVLHRIGIAARQGEDFQARFSVPAGRPLNRLYREPPNWSFFFAPAMVNNSL